jgi:hypothetical protein
MASSLVMMRRRSSSIPGTLRGCDPVATMICFVAVSVCLSPSVISTLPPPARPAAALDPGDLVPLEQQLDAACEPLDDLVLAGLHLGPVEADRLLHRA